MDASLPSAATASRAQVASLSDAELLERAKAANDGGKFVDLWRGHWKPYAPSQSEGDLTLACKLAFWTGGDIPRMDRLFRRSELMRPNDSLDPLDQAEYVGTFEGDLEQVLAWIGARGRLAIIEPARLTARPPPKPGPRD